MEPKKARGLCFNGFLLDMSEKFLSFAVLIILSLCVISFCNGVQIQKDLLSRRTRTKRQSDEKESEINGFLSDCETAKELVPEENIEFKIPEVHPGKYYTGFTCTWYLLGDTGCTPQFRCDTFDIRPQQNCDGDYVMITDGLGGYTKECGKDRFKIPVVASRKDANDLYLTVHIAKDNKFQRGFKGLSCTASCVNSTEKLKPQRIKTDVDSQKRKFDRSCTCGVRKTGRIVSGKNVVLNEFPWQAAMVNKNTRQIRCGASIINDMFILTATHCLYDMTYGTLIDTNMIDILLHANLLDQTLAHGWANVSLGEKGSIQSPGWNLEKKTDEDEHTMRFEVEEIIRHPAYDPYTLDFDVALIRLKTKIDFHNRESPVAPICLPNVLGANQSVLAEEDHLWVVGWGLAHEDSKGSTRLLQKLMVPYIESEPCEKIVYDPHALEPKEITDRMLCAGDPKGGYDSCQGDSGGPLFVEENGKYKRATQMGIVSHGSTNGCARKGQVGIYSRLTALNQWIFSQTLKATWCKEW